MSLTSDMVVELMFEGYRSEDDQGTILPAGFDEIEPGLELTRILSRIEVSELNGYDRVLVLRAHQKLASHYQAEVYRDMVAVFECWEQEGDPEEVDLSFATAEAEIGSALHLTRRATAGDLGFAWGLLALPVVFTALLCGRIDRRRAGVLVKGLCHLRPETARVISEEGIEKAARLTSGQLAAYLRKLIIEADPEEAKRRYEQALAERRIEIEASGDGTAHLNAYHLPAAEAVAALHRIAEIALSLKTKGEFRTLDQLRADVLLDLLSGKVFSLAERKGTVDLQVDLETLVNLAESPGEMAGFGPVIADIARQIAAEQVAGEWRFTVTHPETGLPVANGITKRRPTSSQRRFVEARNRSCVFPGCRMPSRRCDLDHRVPYSDGGPTTVCNLAPLCRRHHVIRHRAGWKHKPLDSGDHLWTSPLGHRYTTSGRAP